MRLIDADVLDLYEALKSYYGDAWRDAQAVIDDAPTVDAIPVIRCKDCKRNKSDKWVDCPITEMYGRTIDNDKRVIAKEMGCSLSLVEYHIRAMRRIEE